jgi:hypothetical protein
MMENKALREPAGSGGTRARVGRAALIAGGCVITLGALDFAKSAVSRGALLTVLGIALAALASRLLPSKGGAGPPPGRLAPREWAFLAAVTVGAGILRFLALGRWPPGGFFDEAQNVLVAERILRGQLSVYIGDSTQMPALFFYLVAGTVALLGKSIVAVRCLSALIGTATVPLFYLLARRFSPGIAAAASTVLLAGSRWHVNFSRVGFTGVFCPLIEILSVLALLRALERGRRRDYALLGVALAVGLQTYYAFNLFPVVLLVTATAFLWLSPWHASGQDLRRVVGGLVLTAATATVLLAPLGAYALGHPREFLQRTDTVVIWNPAHHLQFPDALWQNVKAHLLMFNYRGDSNPRHNITDWPLLTSIEGVLLALGLGCALGRGVRFPQAVPLAWLAVMLLPGILTIEAPQAYRTIGAIPAVFLLISHGFEVIARSAAGSERERRGDRLLGPSLAVLAIVTGAQNVATYFALQVRDPGAWTAFEADYHEVARTIKSEGDGYRIWVDPIYFDYPILRLRLGENFRYNRFVLSEHIPPRSSGGAGRPPGDFFLLEGFKRDLIPLFRRVFPEAVTRQHLDPFGRVMFVTITVPWRRGEPPPDPALAERGYRAAFYPGSRWTAAPALVLHDPAVFFRFHWEGDGLPGAFGADWVAHLRVASAGEYVFDLLASGPSYVLVDGAIVVAQDRVDDMDTRRGTVHLAPGDHLLVVRYERAGYVSTVRCWWQPPGARRPSVIPLDNLTPLDQDEYLRLRGRLPLPPPVVTQ